MKIDRPSVDESAQAIGNELGLDLSYLTDEGERRFDPITMATGAGFVLLGWFLEGVTGALHEEVSGAGKTLTTRLIARLKNLFSKNERPTSEEVAETAANARATALDHSRADVMKAVDSATRGLIRYLILNMPEATAIRIAHCVRHEVARQLGPFSPSGTDPRPG